MEEVEEFKTWALLEEIMWRQKSREVWLKERDRNTRFFYKIANSHRNHNEVTKLKINEIWFREGHDLKQGVVDAFQTLLSDQGDWRANLEGLVFSKLDEHKTVNLEKPFTEEEITFALHELNGEKAPSSDRYTAAFWQFSWETVKDEVMAVFRHFFCVWKICDKPESNFHSNGSGEGMG